MTSQYGEFLALARRIRPHLPGVRIVAGGPHACAAPEETLRDGGADIVVVGEGEPIAPALFDVPRRRMRSAREWPASPSWTKRARA